MGVLDRRMILGLDGWSCPDAVHVVVGVASVSFVEGDEEGGFLCPEDAAVQDQWDEFAEVVVSFGD